jgi:hypothetical protein
MLLGLLATVPTAHAADFHPPTGFNGRAWGDGLSAFKGVRLWRANTAMESTGKVVEFRDAYGQRLEGEGSFALAEYYFDRDRNPWVAQHVDLFIISYLFCSRWQGPYLPRTVKSRLKLCGARLMFRSETLEQRAARGDSDTNFDRLLRQLIALHGAPEGFQRSGRITVETEDQRLTTPEKPTPDFIRYRWCGVTEPAVRPSCEATVTLAFDARTGAGTVLYATPQMYDYAYARHRTSDENNELYVLLNDRPLDQAYQPVKHECTGGHLCRPQKRAMSAKDAIAFQP